MLPGASDSTRALVSGPASCGTEPSRHSSSTPPVGTLRWTYGAAPGGMRCTQVDDTSPASTAVGGRST